MSLATRCTACGTVFRVVQDQLKVSEGWVRCGRCNAVFNAVEGLFDLERDLPAAGATAHAAPQSFDGNAVTAPSSAGMPSDALQVEASKFAETMPFEPRSMVESGAPVPSVSTAPASGSTPAMRVEERDRLEFPDAEFPSDMLVEEERAAEATASSPALPADENAEPATGDAAPAFVRHAQRRAMWNSPRMLAWQGGAALLLTLALALQAAHQFRDGLAVRWPAAQPLLMRWCAWASCRLAPPKRIEDVAVESSALTRAAAPDAFNLSVVLRNRGSWPVAMPSIDLSLTDANGQLVVRRMLAPNDFQTTSTTLRPNAETPLRLVLSAGAARVSGYTVEIFYP